MTAADYLDLFTDAVSLHADLFYALLALLVGVGVVRVIVAVLKGSVR